MAKSGTTAEPSGRSAVFTAALGKMGAVVKGKQITVAQAVEQRRMGRDVVVCGANLISNLQIGQRIEAEASGRFIFHAAHSGPDSLSHFQPKVRGPAGHTFIESHPLRKAK